MTDVFTPDKRSDVMSRIRSRGNRDTELKLAKLFRQHHITGWRRHLKLKVGATKQSSELVVRPDFVFPRSRVAVFVDGCFWHSCPEHSKLPENNYSFWEKKLTANKVRDKLVNRLMRKAGWQVVRIWEHDLAKRADVCAQRVGLALKPQEN